LTWNFLGIFSEFYMGPVARGYNSVAHFNNTLYISFNRHNYSLFVP
jgi:hypothetical protein